MSIKAQLAAWLAPRGLAFNEDKTAVVSLEEGYDFLGFNVRRYHGKPPIKPSKRPSDGSGSASAQNYGPCVGPMQRR